MAQPNEICPHEDGIEVTDFSADIDIQTTYGQVCARAVEIVTVGATPTIAVVTGKGQSRTYTALAAGFLGGSRGLQVRKILATGTSNVTKARIWL
jgi:hypothetical protein